MLIASGRSPARVPACEQALLHVLAKFYHLVDGADESWFEGVRLRYDLRFDKWHDDYDAKTRDWREKHDVRTAYVDNFTPVLTRALSLLGPGELPALRVRDLDVFRLMTPQFEQAIDALRVVQVDRYDGASPDMGPLVAVLERHSSTITGLNLALNKEMLAEAASAIASCTRLESLIGASRLAPAAWIGLSQLHTLRDVDLDKVSMAAIAAALPRLHTIHAHCFTTATPNSDAVAGFFTDLLPRLREFRFFGEWPMARAELAVAASAAQLDRAAAAATTLPLPLLEVFKWEPVHASPSALLHRFLGAQPTVLHMPYEMLAESLRAAPEEPASTFLALAREVNILRHVAPLTLSCVAQVLRAAPRLHTFLAKTGGRNMSCLTELPLPLDPAFVGLVYPRLRRFCVDVERTGSRKK
jgi:hypothetical protein